MSRQPDWVGVLADYPEKLYRNDTKPLDRHMAIYPEKPLWQGVFDNSDHLESLLLHLLRRGTDVLCADQEKTGTCDEP